MQQIIEELNPGQREAVETTDGPLLVLAGAGSGKTKTLTHRIAYLVANGLAAPENILAVTFTNKAAGEMRARLASILGMDSAHRGFMPYMGTFHGVCVRILRQDGPALGVDSNFVIFDDSDRLATIRQILKQLGVVDKQASPRAILNLISGAKNELIEPQTYAQFASTPVQKVASQVYPKYNRQLSQAQALDFDDLIGKTVELLTNYPEVSKKWRSQFGYVMIDEYQDTNNAQYRLVKLLVDKHNNLAVVGDDWQSIYSWRGADFKTILNFDNDYPNAKVVKLEQNYRSTQEILDAADKVIKNNKNRSDKKLWTDVKSGKPVAIERVGDDRGEGEYIVSKIKTDVASGKREYGDFAVLYRTNAQSRSLEETLVRYGIPYKIVGGVRFYDRKEIKDLIAYLRYIYQPEDQSSFLRVVNLPTRGIGQKSLSNFFEWQAANNYSLWQALQLVQQCKSLTTKARTSLNGFAQLIKSLQALAEESKLDQLIEMLVNRLNYFDYLDDGSLQSADRIENVKELVSVAKEYAELGLPGFLEEVSLVSDLDGYEQSAQAVTLMTLHAAKGLEFPVVMMVGLEESVLPHSRALYEQSEMEEERRLCYVGMTRAKEELIMLHAERRMLYGGVQHNQPSRFLSEIDEDYLDSAQTSYAQVFEFGPKDAVSTIGLPELAVRDQVEHQVFGQGIIHALDGEIATINFFKAGQKKLNIAFAPVKKIG